MRGFSTTCGKEKEGAWGPAEAVLQPSPARVEGAGVLLAEAVRGPRHSLDSRVPRLFHLLFSEGLLTQKAFKHKVPLRLCLRPASLLVMSHPFVWACAPARTRTCRACTHASTAGVPAWGCGSLCAPAHLHACVW